MGIRFRCHHCESALHVKDFQAGKRGRCPECGRPFRIPLEDAPHSFDPQLKLSELESGASAPQAKSDLVVQNQAAKAKAEKRAKAASAAHGVPQGAASTAATSNRASPVDTASADLAASQVPAAPQVPTAPQVPAPPQTPPPPPPPQPALPRALQVAAEGKWYVRPPSGSQYGPATGATMWQWLTEHRVGRDALVWTEGWPEWVIAEVAFGDFFTTATELSADIPTALAPYTSESKPHALGTSQPAAAGTASAEPLLGDRNRAERKQKRRRNYTLMVVGLAVIMLVLIVALIFVLGSQSS